MSSTRPDAADRAVCVPVAELRRRPSHASECVTECVMGARLRVLDVRDGGRWLRVLAPDGYRAWVRSWSTCGTVGEGAAALAVQVPTSLIRREPSGSSPPVSPVWMGSLLAAGRGRARGWRPVSTPDGRTGWIPGGHVAPARGGFWSPTERRILTAELGPVPAGSLARVIDRARLLIGVPYRWGGTTPAGFDCSGFLRVVFGLEGILLPRDARDQERAVAGWRVGIDPTRLRAGDIVFFGPARGRADHVGLGIEGRPGRFIHASGRVRVSGLARGDPLREPGMAARVVSVARPLVSA